MIVISPTMRLRQYVHALRWMMMATIFWGRMLVLLGLIPPASCRSPERLFVNLIEGGGGRDSLLVQLRVPVKYPQLVNISVKELTALSLSMLDFFFRINSRSGSGAQRLSDYPLSPYRRPTLGHIQIIVAAAISLGLHNRSG
jgi:hypothetical protein